MTYSVLVIVDGAIAFEHVVRIQDTLVVVLQYGADALTLRVAHAARDLRPLALR